MTQKDYVLLADAIRQAPVPKPHKVVLVQYLNRALYTNNPRFKADKFMLACLVKE